MQLICLVFYLAFAKIATTLKTKRQNCNDDVLIRECNIGGTSNDMLLIFIRSQTNQLIVLYKTICSYDSIKYQWIVHSEIQEKPIKDFEGEKIYVIEPFTFQKGSLGVSVNVTISRGSNVFSLLASCAVKVEALDPIPVIIGGGKRMVTANLQFTVDGSQSIDQDVPKNQPGKLIYDWKCKILKGTTNDFCNSHFTTASVTIPSTYALTNNHYLFTLSVRNEDSSKWISTSQTIEIFENLAELEIICEKNCPPAAPKTDKTQITFLRVRCLRNCDQIIDSSYEWSIEGANIDYATQTQLGRRTDKLIITENVLEASKTYKVLVKLKEVRFGEAETNLDVSASIKIESCVATPSKGIAIETKFSVKCEYKGVGHFFEIFTKNDATTVTLTKNYNLESLIFTLPSQTDTFVKISDVNGFSDISELNLEVENPPQNPTAYLDLIKSELKENNLDSVIQISNALIPQLRKQHPETAKSLKASLLKMLQSITSKSQSMINLISELVNDPKAASDPDQAETVTEICKHASETDLQNLQNERYPKTQTLHAQARTKTLISCAETDTKSNFKMLEPNPLDFEVTTPFPLLELPVIKEDYPDYVNDELAAERIVKYKLAANNYVDICHNTLQMLGLTVVEGEETLAAASDNSSVQITRVSGKRLTELEIHINGAKFQPSLDFLDEKESIDLRICSWRNDPFWWNPKRKAISTRVMLIELQKNAEEIKTFKKPNRIVFDVLNHPEKLIHKVTLSGNDIVRIEVKKNVNFFIEFHNLTESDIFKARITNFYKPAIVEVTNGVVVNKQKNKLTQIEKNHYDSWYYLSVLPKRQPPQNLKNLKSFTFWISVMSTSCYSWNNQSDDWEFACEAEPNDNKAAIYCSCLHLSILSGIIYNNRIKIDKVLYDSDFEMILIRSLIIFITLCVTFAFYCFLLLWSLKDSAFVLYLPGDISPYSRYAYLVMIRTGRKPSSSTSSNICIKIIGEKNESLAHVLNYPDPRKKLFQKNNQDWFVITTDRHLGEIKEIELWSDFSGRQPSWFCQAIKLEDLQSHQKWEFFVNQWLDLPPNGRTILKVQSSKKPKKQFWRILTGFVPKWSFQSSFSYTRKLSLFFAQILEIYTICLLFYGLPKLQLNDGFDKYEVFRFEPIVFWNAFVASMISFSFHTSLNLLFRLGDLKSKKIQFIANCLLLVTIIVSMSLLVIYGFWVPKIVGFLWLTSSLLALVFYIFVLEIIFEFFWNWLIIEKLPSWRENVRKILTYIETTRNYLFQKFGENLLRPYFFRLYAPLNSDEIKERKLKQEARNKFLILVEDTIMFSCYVILLYLAIYVNKNSMTVWNYKQMLNLISGESIRGENLEKLQSPTELYHFVNYTLIPTLHSQQWYSKYVIQEPGLMADFHNKFLGVARLRQKRVIQRNCPETILKPKNSTCRLEFYQTYEDHQGFGPKIGNFSRLSKIWSYTSALRAGIFFYFGFFGVYSGGGFIAPLGRTLFNSYANLIHLKNNSWLDRSMGVFFIEFLTYNVNTNLFNTVTLAIEKSASGFAISTKKLNTCQFLFLKDEEMIAETVIASIFVCVIVIFTIKFLARIWKIRFFVWRDLWILVDLIIVCLSYTCLGVFLHRAKSVKKFLDKIEMQRKNEFVDYFHLLYEENVFLLVSASLVFVATVRLWKVCRFGTNFKLMEKTIIMSFTSILSVALAHLILLMAYFFTGHLLFNSISDDFQNLPRSFVTLMLLIVGLQSQFEFENLIYANPILGRIYYFSFMIINMIFVNMYIIVIMTYYYLAQINSNEFLNVVEFLVKEIHYFKTTCKIKFVRLKGGSNKKFVTPKSKELRYANCLTLRKNTLDFMTCIVIGNLRKYSMNSREKNRLMERIVTTCNEDERIDIFYCEKDEKNVRKVLHDDRIEKVAKTVELILRRDVKEFKERQKRKYQKTVQTQLLKFDFIQQLLKSILRVISNIEII